MSESDCWSASGRSLIISSRSSKGKSNAGGLGDCFIMVVTWMGDEW